MVIAPNCEPLAYRSDLAAFQHEQTSNKKQVAARVILRPMVNSNRIGHLTELLLAHHAQTIQSPKHGGCKGVVGGVRGGCVETQQLTTASWASHFSLRAPLNAQ